MARTQTLGRLAVRIEADANPYLRAMKKVEAQTKRIGQAAINAGKALTKALTLPLAIVGGLGVKAFASFDLAMKKSLSIMKTTGEEVKSMTDLAKNLSLEGPQSATELAQAYFFLASAGKNAQQSVALLPMMQKFATAGSFDLALATDLLTDAQSALGLSSQDAAKDMKNMSRVADVFARANELANTSIQQVSEAITNNAGAALKSYNKDIEEGVALLAAYADQGIKGQVAGSQAARVMLLLSKSSRDASEAHAKLGFHVFDASGKMRNFADIVKNLEDVTRGMSDELKSATLEQLGFEARIQSAILPLLGTSDAIRRYEGELRKAGGTTKRISDKQLEAFSNQMKIVKNNVNLLFIEIGEALAPVLKDLGTKIREVTQWFRQLSPETKKTILIVAAITAVVGPLLIVLGLLLKSIGLIIAAVATLGKGIKLLASRTVLLRIGFVALIAGVVALVRNLAGAEEAQKRLNDAMKEGTRLSGDLDKAFTAKTKSIVSDIAAQPEGKRKAFAEAEIKRISRELEGAKRNLDRANSDLSKKTSGLTGWGNRIASTLGGGDVVGDLRATVATQEAAVKRWREMLKAISESVKKADEEAKKAESLKRLLGTPLDPKVIAGVKDLTASLKEQMGTLGKTSAEAEIWKLKMMGASEAQLKPLRKLAEQHKKLEKAHEVATSVTEEFKSASDVYKDRISALNNALEHGLISWEIYGKAVQKAKNDFANATAEVNGLKNAFRGLEGVAAGSKDAKAALRLYREGLKGPGVPGGADIRRAGDEAGKVAAIGKAMGPGMAGAAKSISSGTKIKFGGGSFRKEDVIGETGAGSKGRGPGAGIVGKGMGKGGLPAAKDKEMGKKLDGIADHMKKLIKAVEKKADIEVKPAGFK